MFQDCVRTGEAIRLTGGLTVEIGEDTLLIRRGSPEVEVFRTKCGIWWPTTAVKASLENGEE